MAIKDIFKISRKTFFDPVTWLDVRSFKQFNLMLFRQIKSLFTIPQATRKETFEEAMERFGLNAEQVNEIGLTYHYYAIFFLVIALAILAFALYLLFHHLSFHGALLAIAVAVLSAAQAFKYDFWAFQIKVRKLGCTFQDWKKERLGR